MSRSGNAAFDALLGAPHKDVVLLVYLGLLTPVRLAICAHDVPHDGHTWIASWGGASVSAVQETAQSMEGIQIELACNDITLAAALAEDVYGARCELHMGIIDAVGDLQVDPSVWVGQLDRVGISDAPGRAAVVLFAEHRLADWDRPIGGSYSNADQQQRWPGDLGLQYATDIEDKAIVWPGAEFFKR